MALYTRKYKFWIKLQKIQLNNKIYKKNVKLIDDYCFKFIYILKNYKNVIYIENSSPKFKKKHEEVTKL